MHKFEVCGRAHVVDMKPSGKEQVNFNEFVQSSMTTTGYNSFRLFNIKFIHTYIHVHCTLYILSSLVVHYEAYIILST